MNRRGFLGAMFAAGTAPAIVKAENLMKIFVPPEKKIIVGRGCTHSFFLVDEMAWFDELRETTVRDYTNVWTSGYLSPSVVGTDLVGERSY